MMLTMLVYCLFFAGILHVALSMHIVPVACAYMMHKTFCMVGNSKRHFQTLSTFKRHFHFWEDFKTVITSVQYSVMSLFIQKRSQTKSRPWYVSYLKPIEQSIYEVWKEKITVALGSFNLKIHWWVAEITTRFSKIFRMLPNFQGIVFDILNNSFIRDFSYSWRSTLEYYYKNFWHQRNLRSPKFMKKEL